MTRAENPTSQGEARMLAAQFALEAIDRYPMTGAFGSRAVASEIKLIEDWLRRRAVGGDKVLLRQLGRETGRQVKPTAAQARALGRIAKGRRQ